MTTTSATPPASAEAPTAVSRTLKIWLAGCTLVGTGLTSVVNGYVNQYFANEQSDSTSRKDSVRKLESLIEETDKLTRIFVNEAYKDSISESTKQNLRNSIQAQYLQLQSLRHLLSKSEDLAVISQYQDRLLQMNVLIRSSRDTRSSMPFAQSVSFGVDDRIAAVRLLRLSVGLPVEPLDPSGKDPVRNFGE